MKYFNKLDMVNGLQQHIRHISLRNKPKDSKISKLSTKISTAFKVGTYL